MSTVTILGTRAVEMVIEPGGNVVCAWCGQRVKFMAKAPREERRQVVSNVYGRDGDPAVWDRVEHHHLLCYREAGEPNGSPSVRRMPHHASTR